MHYLVYLLNFVNNQYFCHDSHFSSFRQFFVKNEILLMLVAQRFYTSLTGSKIIYVTKNTSEIATHP